MKYPDGIALQKTATTLKDKSLFKAMRSRTGIEKTADYSDIFTSESLPEFSLDAYSPDTKKAFKHQQAIAKALAERLQSVMEGRHGNGYYGSGRNETAIPAALFIQTAANKVTPYAEWKKSIDAAIVNQDAAKLRALTGTDALPYAFRYYVGTNSPKPRYSDIVLDDYAAPSEEAIRALYAKAPNMEDMLKQRAEQATIEQRISELVQQEAALEGAYTKAQDNIRRDRGEKTRESLQQIELLKRKLLPQLKAIYKQHAELMDKRFALVDGLKKQAKKVPMLDVGNGWQIPDTGAEAQADAEYIRRETRPMTFGEAFADSMPAALLAAAIGGVGSVALSRGSLAAGGIGAAGSFLGTALLNAASNDGKARKSIEEALADRGYAV